MTDRKDIERLFRQHYRQMYRLATILLHDDAESKDVVHDVFAQLLSDSRSLREDTAEAFLLTSVRNRCLNVVRNRQIQERIQRLYFLDLETTILSERLLREEIDALNEGIRRLHPPICHDIILWHFRDGLTFSEIARRLQVSETTVYKHLRRALESLRVQLKTPESV
ncbi:MAG: sigma-70 family RNA polymerase sigma factor [Prevotella sp.]|nr:sigma-70 family RNA polymerase sigma factor [Prevotella sp.]